ncbi:MAG TPA: type II toxin-antitoxin system RelE/ParE family toxin [Candidatus Paceibacterota bacterium]
MLNCMKVIILDETNEFILNIDEIDRSRSRKYIGLLEDFGHLLRMPYSKNILPYIFELRVGGIHNIRLVYTFYKNFAIIFYAFMKKTEQIGVKEMNTIKTKYNSLQI